MALFGVVFAVGAGSAAAQVTISGARDTTLDEGDILTWTITVKWQQAAGATGSLVEVNAAVAPASTGITTTGAPDAVTAGGTLVAPLYEPHDLIHNAGTGQGSFQIPAGPASGDPSKGTETYVFELRTIPDYDAEDEKLTVTFTVDNTAGITGQESTPEALAAPSDAVRNITIKDAQEQTFEWEKPDDADTSPTEGTTTTRTLGTEPRPLQLEWSANLSLNDADYRRNYRLDTGSTTFTRSARERNISITSPDSDGNREDDTVELSAFLSGTSNLLPGIDGPLEITFEDVHALPEAGKITAQAYEDREGDATGITTTETDAVTEGGDPVHVRVTIDRGSKGYPSGEKLVVTPRPVRPDQNVDVRFEPNSIEIPTGNNKQFADFLLYARADDDVGAETLELGLVTKGEKPANGPGEVVGTFSIDIVDATRALVAAQAQEAAEAAVMAALGDGPLNPGDSFTLDTTRLFNWTPAAVDVAFAASVSGAAASASVSSETVTVRAEAAGDATVTVTATATDKASSAVSTSQTLANSASVTFDVQVVLADLAIVLSGPADMNVVEGVQPAVVTAKANRAVTKDTTVRLVATAGDASPGDYAVRDIVIETGADEGAALLTATPDAEGERSETLTLQGQFVDDESGKDKETNALTFTLWDAAVPALPVVAQLLLAAFLAVGGYRRYRRRR